MKKALALLVLATIVLSGCTKDKVTNLDEKIIGKWIIADIDGQPAPTNRKKVTTFVSTTQAYLSASLNVPTYEPTLWGDNEEAAVAINGNTLTLTVHPNEHLTGVEEYNITSINGSEFIAKRKITVTVDGVLKLNIDDVVRFVKVTDDYSTDILGTWEGRSTGEEGSEFDDGENHRWEYRADGTFSYFHKVNDQWVMSDDAFANYFLAGNLLCTRWMNNGEGMEEHCEWWEIVSISNGMMKWTGLRQREDGTTYTASFSMEKVNN